MSFPSLPSVVLLAMLSASCASVPSVRMPQGPQDPMQPPGYGPRRNAGEGRWGERFVVDGAAIPAAWLRFDTDDESPGAPDPEEMDGFGYSGRVAVGNKDQSIGVLYQGYEFSGDLADVSVHSLFADFDVRVPLEDGGGLFSFLVGAGFGFARFETGTVASQPDNEGAAQLRFVLEYNAAKSLTFDLGGGGVVYGHPGETEAYGTFVLLGMTATF